MPEAGFGGDGRGVCVVKVKLTIGFARVLALRKLHLLLSPTASLQIAALGDGYTGGVKRIGVAREGWGCRLPKAPAREMPTSRGRVFSGPALSLCRTCCRSCNERLSDFRALRTANPSCRSRLCLCVSCASHRAPEASARHKVNPDIAPSFSFGMTAQICGCASQNPPWLRKNRTPGPSTSARP